jgi:ferritin-like metal-binding protein YciE
VSLVNPRDLLLQQLAELLWIERTLYFEVLPAVHDASHAPALQQALTDHRGETHEHETRVADAIRAAGAEPAAARSATLDAMKKEYEEQAQQVTQATLKDVFNCAAASRTEHFELACYEAAIALARELGLKDVARLLEQNRDEDEQALKKIDKVADGLRDTLPR